jgi:hypothetical protein
VTAPTKRRDEVDFIKPHDQARKPMSLTMTNDIAAQRLISLLNELVAQGALPVL